MTKNRKRRPKIFTHALHTKVSDSTYLKLCHLLDQNPGNDMSNLVRTILNKGKVRVFTRDQTIDIIVEELARHRTEIKRIGININQITKQFNSYPEPHRKALYAKIAFEQYLAIEPKIDRLLEIVAQLAKKWLSE